MLDDLFLLRGGLPGKRRAILPGCRRLQREPARIHRERVAFRDDDRSFDHVLQFPNVSRPGVRAQPFESFLLDGSYFLPGFPRITVDEILDQRSDILPPLAEWWNLDG